MAAIVRRNKNFAVVYMIIVDGVRKQKWETYHSIEEAERRKQIIETYLAKALRTPVTTVEQLMEEYVEFYGKIKWSLSTFNANESLIRRYICPAIGIIRLSELSPRIVAELYREMLKFPRSEGKYCNTEGKTISARTLWSIHKILHSAFERAVLWEYIVRNPVHGAVLPAICVRQQKILSAKEIARLTRGCEDEMLAIAIELTFACTLRRGELLALTWDDIDFERHTISVNKTMLRVNCEALASLEYKDVVHLFPALKSQPTTRLVLKKPKTGSSVRTVYLPATLEAKLWQYRQIELEAGMARDTGDPPMVFCIANGRPLQETTLMKRYRALLQRAGMLRVTFHSLRHSSVTYKLLLTHGDIKAVQGDSGHAQAMMVTDVYGHILDENRRMNAELFERSFYQRTE